MMQKNLRAKPADMTATLHDFPVSAENTHPLPRSRPISLFGEPPGDQLVGSCPFPRGEETNPPPRKEAKETKAAPAATGEKKGKPVVNRTVRVDIEKLDVLVSDAPVIKSVQVDDEGKKTVGSVSFVPSVAGLLIASEVIKDLIK